MIRKTDIREEGTGNAGASNVVMVVGGGTILALFIVNYLALATLIPLLIFHILLGGLDFPMRSFLRQVLHPCTVSIFTGEIFSASEERRTNFSSFC